MTRKGPPSMVIIGWIAETVEPTEDTQVPMQWEDDSPAGRVLRALKVGNYLEPAADWAGVSAAVVLKWKRKGREKWPTDRDGHELIEFDRMKIDDDDRPFVDFVVAVRHAEAHAEVELVTLWRGAARDDWKAAMNLLARRQGGRWKENVGHQVSGPDGGPVQIATQSLDMAKLIATDPEARRLSSQLLAKLAGATPPDIEPDEDTTVAIEDELPRTPGHWIDPDNPPSAVLADRPPADEWPDDEEDDAGPPDP